MKITFRTIPVAGRKNLVIIMRTFIFLFCAVTFGFNTNSSFSQNVKITLKADRLMSVEEVFEIIRDQTDYTFIYKSDTFKDAPKIYVKKGVITAHDLLLKALSYANMSYELTSNNTIRLKKETKPEPIRTEVVQQSLIIGTVVDENGNGLPGASVLIKNTRNGVTTDFYGNFAINAEIDNTLVFSYLGYGTVEKVIKDLTPISVTLTPSVDLLDEVIIVSTGYQQISKERSAGSFAKVDVSSIQNRPVSNNILATLDGLVPGLVVNSAPNASNNPLLIRGLTTIGTLNEFGEYAGGTNRNPLYVLDGVAIDDLSSIDSQDVESISVLKDATAASIWGSRAANGVIVITSKKGRNGDKIKVEYDNYFNFIGKPDLDYIPLLNSEQFIEGAKLGFNPVSQPWDQIIQYRPTKSGLTPHDMIFYDEYRGLITQYEYASRLEKLASLNNSEQIKDLLFRNASIKNQSFSISGGGNIYSFYGSLGYNNYISDRPGEDDKTYRVNLRQDAKLSKNIQLFLITNFTNNNTESKRYPNITNTFIPYQLLKDENGMNVSMPYLKGISDPIRIEFENRSRINLDYVPLDEFNYGRTRSKQYTSRVTGGLNINLLDGLKFEGTYNYSNSQVTTNSFDSEKSYLVRRKVAEFTVANTPQDNPIYYLPEKGGKYRVDNRDGQEWTVRNQLLFDKNLNNLHQVTLLVGQEAFENVIKSDRNIVWGYDEDLLLYKEIDILKLSTGISNTVVPTLISSSTLSRGDFGFAQSELTTRLTSYYSNASYTFDYKYTVNGSWRIDRSNLFGIDKSAQAKPVWSVGLNWNMHNENFMKELSWLDRLSLRVSSGISGNAPSPGTAASQDVIGFGNSTWSYSGQSATITSVGNDKLTWERTKNYNIGLDFSLFTKIRGSFDVYRKETSDLIGLLETNIFTGYPNIIGNVGDMTNKGFELSLNTTNINKSGFSWESSFVLSHNTNLITKLNNPVNISSGDQLTRQEYVEGHPAFSVFAYNFAGLDNMGDPQIKLLNGEISKGLDIALPEDILNMGSSQPLWSGGLSNTFNYKNLSLTANMTYNLGHVMRVPDFWKFSGMWDRNVSTDFLNRWQKPGDENSTDIPSYVSIDESARRNVEYFTLGNNNVVDASYIKLRDVTLSYSLPKNAIEQINMSALKLRLTYNNLMLWKANKKGIYPEFQATMPSMQNTVTFGVHASF